MVDENGRRKAENVTGPMGAYVQGAPRRTRMDYDGYRGGFGSQSGFGSFGSNSNFGNFGERESTGLDGPETEPTDKK